MVLTLNTVLRCASWVIVLAVLFVCSGSRSSAVEGNTAAGPIGGTDIRSAVLPPPGFYGGIIGLISPVHEIHGGTGQPVPGLDAVNLIARIAGPFFVYVPDFKLLDGSIGLIGVVPVGQECGQLVTAVPSRCISGFGDPYFEVAWSRSFGRLRPSHDPGAFPIMEGVTIGLGLGVVIPFGKYDASLQSTNGITIGNNTFDIAPSVAVTYTTPPIMFEGTEFSAKLYWNNYGTNSLTQYQAGSLIDVDFAISEHIGRYQVGVTGFYAFQIADDQKLGVTIPPDGRRIELLNVGAIANYDIPEFGSVFRIKALTTAVARNAPTSTTVVIGFAKKLF
jgi:hypothetical protein